MFEGRLPGVCRTLTLISILLFHLFLFWACWLKNTSEDVHIPFESSIGANSFWNTAAEGEPLSLFFMVKRRAAHFKHSHFENAVPLTSLDILMPKKYSITESYVLHFRISFLFLLLQTPPSQIWQRRFNLFECNSGECDGPRIGPRYNVSLRRNSAFRVPRHSFDSRLVRHKKLSENRLIRR